MIEFTSINELLNKAKNLSDNIWKKSVDKSVKETIINLNTTDQLGSKGIDSLGDSLGEYAPFTVNLRLEKGLQVGHVDFKVTGKYWASWKIKVTESEIIINVDESRFNELVNELRFSEEHVGLTDINFAIVKEMIRENYIKNARKQLL